METKQQLRKWAKTERNKLDINSISAKLVVALQVSDDYKKSKHILIFYPLDNEINLLPLLKDNSKTFYLPKIDKENLICCPFSEGDKTCLSCFKTCEPLTEPCSKDLIDLVVVPALAVDKNGYRLGYGGGFYDRFLKGFKGKTLVCIPKELIVDNIFPEKHDIKIDKIISV